MSGKFISLSRPMGNSLVENNLSNLINTLNNMTNNKQRAIVCVRGPFGSGKSHVVDELEKLSNDNNNIFDFNDYLVRIGKDEPRPVDWSDEGVATAYDNLKKAVQKHLRQNFAEKNCGHTVVVAPFIKLTDLKPYRVMMQQYDQNKFVVHECLPSLPENQQERADYLRDQVKINTVIPEVAKSLKQQKESLKEDDLDLSPSQNRLFKHLCSSQNSLRNTPSQTRFTNNVLEDIQLAAYLMHRSSECKLMEIHWDQLCNFEYISSDNALWR